MASAIQRRNRALQETLGTGGMSRRSQGSFLSSGGGGMIAGTTGVTGLGAGLAGSGASSIARLNSSSTWLAAFLNSRMDLPRPLASSGSFSPPNSSRMMKKISSISGPPRPSMNAGDGKAKDIAGTMTSQSAGSNIKNIRDGGLALLDGHGHDKILGLPGATKCSPFLCSAAFGGPIHG